MTNSTITRPRTLHAFVRSILANVEHLTDPDDRHLHPSQRARLDEIARSARAVLDALDPLEELENARLGALPVRLEAVDPEWLLHESERRLGAETAKAGHALEVRCEHRLSRFRTDPWRVQQILGWIVRRATQYESHAATVRIELRPVLDVSARETPRGATCFSFAVTIVRRALGACSGALTTAHGVNVKAMWEPAVYLEVARRVARELGGEIVVRLGERGDEIVDLLLPAYAVADAR